MPLLLIIAPLLEKYLGFSSEMIGVITVVYLLFELIKILLLFINASLLKTVFIDSD
jgi:hypothetical protein